MNISNLVFLINLKLFFMALKYNNISHIMTQLSELQHIRILNY